VDQLSPALKAEVLDRGAWIKDLDMFNGQQLSRDFVVGICQRLSGEVYEPGETVAWDDQLFIVNRGVASRRGKIKTQGTFWGQDFILECVDLKDKFVGHALTYVEILVLRRPAFTHLLEEFPLENAMVRRATVRMSVCRGILAAAKLIRDNATFDKTGERPGKSFTDLLQEKMNIENHNHVSPEQRMKELAHLQFKKVAHLEEQVGSISEKLDRLLNMREGQPR